jgi:hypothetical protein
MSTRGCFQIELFELQQVSWLQGGLLCRLYAAVCELRDGCNMLQVVQKVSWPIITRHMKNSMHAPRVKATGAILAATVQNSLTVLIGNVTAM